MQHGKKDGLPSAVEILDLIFSYIFFIKFKHFPVILYYCNFACSPPRQTLSKACLKPRKAQNNLFLYDFDISIRLWKTNLSKVERPLRNPAWLGQITSYRSANSVSLLLIIDVKSLPKQLSRLMGLVFGEFTFPFFLYMGKMFPTAQLSGTITVSNILLNIFVYIGKRKCDVLFICSFKILSMSGLLLFLKFFRAQCSTDGEIGLFISWFISCELLDWSSWQLEGSLGTWSLSQLFHCLIFKWRT